MRLPEIEPEKLGAIYMRLAKRDISVSRNEAFIWVHLDEISRLAEESVCMERINIYNKTIYRIFKF